MESTRGAPSLHRLSDRTLSTGSLIESVMRTTSFSPPSTQHTRHLLFISLAESTKKMYGVGWKSYVQYCAKANPKPLPLTEEVLMNWASSTALSVCKYT